MILECVVFHFKARMLTLKQAKLSCRVMQYLIQVKPLLIQCKSIRAVKVILLEMPHVQTYQIASKELFHSRTAHI